MEVEKLHVDKIDLTNYFVNQLKKNENELMDFDLTKRLTIYFVKRIKKKLGTGTKT